MSDLVLPVELVIASPETTSDAQLLAAFAEFLEIDVANGDATDDTLRSYAESVRLFLAWCVEKGISPVRVTRRDVELYRAFLKESGNAVATRSRKLSIVRRFYEAAIKHELVKENPALRVRGGKDLTPPEEKIKALSRSALSELFRAIPATTFLGKRDRALVALMAVHGLRRVEVHRLDHESIEVSGDKASLKVHGKGNRMRRIFLRDDTYAALVRYIDGKVEKGWPVTGALFVSGSNATRGDRLSRRALNWVVDGYLTPLGLKQDGASCHALRHTHGTLAVAGGAKVEQLRDEMGHARLETTGIYVRAVERVKNNPANFIDVEVE
ncbi:integrase [bacterium]|nr:MAG: integrase [bacterium]